MKGIVARHHDENGITEGVIWKQLLLFFFPIVLGTFFQQLYNTADAIIVGKVVGKEALAAVGGSTGTLVNLLVGFFVGLASGASVIIAQLYGARKAQDVSRAVHTTMALALASGALLTVVGLIFARGLLDLMGTPAEVMVYAVPYLQIYFVGMIPQLIYNIGSGVLRAVGDSRRPMLFLICAALTNVVLDIVLVLGLLGWTGIARLVYGNTLAVREREYVLAARALGARTGTILRRNVLPNVVSPVWCAIPLRAGRAILSESSLSFLGFGIRTPQASWGSMIQYASNLTVLTGRPWVWLPPGLCIILTVLCLAGVGDGLRDALDPKYQSTPGPKHRNKKM